MSIQSEKSSLWQSGFRPAGGIPGKKFLIGALLVLSSTVLSLAGTAIPVDQLPQPVTAAIESYFPQSRLMQAEQEKKRGKEHYEVRIQYRDLQLEVEVSSEGKILDVDMES